MSAALLVKANMHWQDFLSSTDISAMSEKQLIKYNARYECGDIIVVKPAGHIWGSCEKRPEFIVVIVEELDEKDAKQYESMLVERAADNLEPRILKLRRYRLDAAIFNQKFDKNDCCVLDLKTFEFLLVDKT